MPLVIVAIGVALLLLLMIRFKMNGFIALVLVALAVGLMQGMPLDKVIVSIKNGVGGTLGSLALIMGFGAMLGKLLADCGGEACSGLVLIPFKCNLEDSDLTTEEYNLDGLLDYPVLADVGCLALNADTDAAGLKAAKSAALWLYSNGAGEDALTETLGVVTPWNTAADSTAVLAMQIEQVGTGILPGAVLDTATAEALTANELSLQGSEKHTKAERTAFVEGALAALGAE